MSSLTSACFTILPCSPCLHAAPIFQTQGGMVVHGEPHSFGLGVILFLIRILLVPSKIQIDKIQNFIQTFPSPISSFLNNVNLVPLDFWFSVCFLTSFLS